MIKLNTQRVGMFKLYPHIKLHLLASSSSLL